MSQFNRAQLVTLDEARAMVASIKDSQFANMGGGIAPEVLAEPPAPPPLETPFDPDKSGIYLPSWEGGPESFQEPNYTDPDTGKQYLFYHLRFNSGVAGVNIGLIYDKIKRYAGNRPYVFGTVAAEVNDLAARQANA